MLPIIVGENTEISLSFSLCVYTGAFPEYIYVFIYIYKLCVCVYMRAHMHYLTLNFTALKLMHVYSVHWDILQVCIGLQPQRESQCGMVDKSTGSEQQYPRFKYLGNLDISWYHSLSYR